MKRESILMAYRNSNSAVEVPFQHHFNSRSSREIFGLFFGPGIARGQTIDRTVEQISVAPTIGRLINMDTEHCEGPVLDELFI